VNLTNIGALCKDQVFQEQIRVAAVSHAVQIMQSPPTDHGAADDLRWGLARSVLADGCTADLQRFVYGIGCTPGFSSVQGDTLGANDPAIASAMVSQWDYLAGITPPMVGG